MQAVAPHVSKEKSEFDRNVAAQEKQMVAGIPVHRVTFTEITKKAVTEALASPRTINQGMVDAYLARTALDRLFGYTLSPLLWRRLPCARSAGGHLSELKFRK